MVRSLRKRGELDKLPELMEFADKLEKACIDTIENGEMTGDLYLISTLENKKKLNTEEFIMAIRKTLEGLMQGNKYQNVSKGYFSTIVQAQMGKTF